MHKNKKIKLPNKLRKLGFKKIYQDEEGFFMFGMSPADLNKNSKGGKNVNKK